jgi:hypothetical protein
MSSGSPQDHTGSTGPRGHYPVCIRCWNCARNESPSNALKRPPPVRHGSRSRARMPSPKTNSFSSAWRCFQAVARQAILRCDMYVNAGIENDWTEPPEIVRNCRELRHDVTDREDALHSCLHIVRCDICRYYYKYVGSRIFQETSNTRGTNSSD